MCIRDRSTTFNCVSRYYRPTQGRIVFDGVDITKKKPHEMAALGVARTFQNLELFSALSVRENALLGTYAHGANTVSYTHLDVYKRQGSAEGWSARIAAVAEQTLEKMAPTLVERWLTDGYRAAEPGLSQVLVDMLRRTSDAGY